MVSETAIGAGKYSPRVQRKRLERQEKIVDTAMALLALGGLESVTVGRLAGELDYTPGALYRYFPSMEVLLAHMQRRAIASLHGRITEALDPLAGPDQELARLRAAGATYLEETSAHEVSLISQMLASPKILIADTALAQTAPTLVALLLLVDELITTAQEAGALAPGDSRNRAVQLWAALQGAVSLGKLSRFEPGLFSARAVGHDLVENLLVAWGATPSTIETK